jgi:hypothetical protein
MQDNMKEKEMSPCMQFGNLTEKNSLTTTIFVLTKTNSLKFVVLRDVSVGQLCQSKI